MEPETQDLQPALATAVHGLNPAASVADGPAGPRHRMALAAGQIAARRQPLARPTSAVGRAIDVLVPGLTPWVAYTAHGHSERGARAAVLQV